MALEIELDKHEIEDNGSLFTATLHLDFGVIHYNNKEEYVEYKLLNELKEKGKKEIYGDLEERIDDILEEGKYNKVFLTTELFNKLFDLKCYINDNLRIKFKGEK